MSQIKWTKIALGSIADIVLGGTPSTAIPKYWIPEIDWVTAKDISETNTAKIYKTERRISKIGLEESPAKVLPSLTTVIIARGATMGKCRMLGSAMSLNQTCYGIIAREDYIDPIFLYYYLTNLYDYFRAMAHGSIFDTVIGSGLRAIKVNLPPLTEQQSIAGILGTLDDKIELNRRMNTTLESMAQTVFNKWFMRNEEVGNWITMTIGEICEFSYGKGLRADGRSSGVIPVYGSNGQIGWHNEYLVKGPGIVIGRKGNPGIVTWAHKDFFPIDTTFYVVPKEKYVSLYWLYYELLSQNLASLGADSAVPGLNRNIAYLSDVHFPPQESMREFDNFARPIFEKINANEEESRTLASLRDALLPKLMRGEVRVKG
jgi:type I restriction enzyme, S subunit